MAEPPSKTPDLALVRGVQSAVAIRRPQPDASEPGHDALNIKDALFAVFKHKRLILVCGLIGIVAAVIFYLFYPPLYESQAKLLVRYVVERSAVDPMDGNAATSRPFDNVMGSEVEILTSWDLAVQVAEAIGPKRLVSHGGAVTREEAAGNISNGLEVTSRTGSNIIFVAYRNRDPQLATTVLDELIKQYFNKHLEVHRSAGAFDFVSQQIDRVRARLNQTEDALTPLKAKIGVISLTDSKTTLSADLARTEGQLHDAEAELAEQQARVKEIEQSNTGVGARVGPAAKATPSAAPNPAASSTSKIADARPPAAIQTQASDADLEKYEILVARLTQMRQAEVEMLAKYTPENEQLKRNRAQLNQALREKSELEKKFPDLPSRLPTNASGGNQGLDLAGERARLAGIQAKTASLRQLFANTQERMKRLSEAGPEIAELERQKDLEEASYKYFEGTLEKARVDEALDPTKIPNISAVQKASPPMPVTKSRNKIALALAGGGFALGFALALLRGLILDQTFKRPVDVEERLGTSLLLSIPFTNSEGTMAGSNLPMVPKTPAKGGGRGRIAPWDMNHFIRPYCEAIRDRLGLYFELNHLTHKPKLVGVTSFSKGAGISTMAAGLAAALSETDDGKVLLVDASLGPGEVHPFFQGRPAYSLTTALTGTESIDSASDNLYLARVNTGSAGPAQLGLKRFFDLMPNLKASDFDYIIFDLPYLEETSPSWGMAAFMDKLLVIVEAEKNHRTLVSRGYRKLVAERDNVSFVFNKARSYVPKVLNGEM